MIYHLSSGVKQNKIGITRRHMINTKRKLSLLLAVLENESKRIETRSHFTRIGRESSGRDGHGRGHGRSHGKRGGRQLPVRTTKMNYPTKQTLSGSRQNSKMAYLTLAQ